MPRNIKTFFVDGTRDIIMDGRAMVVHVIARERDFTHARIAGFAATERDARLFAASADLRAALDNIMDLAESEAETLSELGRDDAETAESATDAWARIAVARSALAKAVTP